MRGETNDSMNEKGGQYNERARESMNGQGGQ